MNATINNNIKYLIFGIHLLVGFLLFKDYGAHTDEFDDMGVAAVSAKYCLKTFLPEKSKQIETANPLYKEIPELSTFYEKQYGIVTFVPPFAIKYVLGIDFFSQESIWIDHLFVFLLFWSASICFFYLVQKLWSNQTVSLISYLLFISNPRFFGESFYNEKDICFLSLIIISLYTLYLLIEKPSLKTAFWFSIFIALAIGTRVIAVIIIPLALVALVLHYLFINKEKIFQSLILLLATIPLVVYLIWPFLWEHPIDNFMYAWSISKNYTKWTGIIPFNGTIYHIPPDNIPKEYLTVWMAISQPIINILLFIAGTIFLFINTLKSKLKFFTSTKNIFIAICFLLWFLPVVAAVISHPIMFNGWRHTYFLLVPIFCLIAYGINNLYHLKTKKIFIGITLVALSYNMYNLFSLHPHQYTYFNFLAGENPQEKYEIDYWGLSYKQAMEHIAKTDTSKILYFASSFSWASRYTNGLKNEDKQRFYQTEPQFANYYITTWDQNVDVNYCKNEVFTIKQGEMKLVSVMKLAPKTYTTPPPKSGLRLTEGANL
jgi:hypothetical protein